MKHSDVKKPFGSAVRAWRTRLGFSQEELADRSGLRRTYICDVECGSRNVTLDTIARLANGLGISASTLLAYSRHPSAVAGRAEPVALEEIVDILCVEDNPRDLELMVRGLKQVSNRIHIAGDGESALAMLFGAQDGARSLPRIRPHLILLDLGLPKIGGLEVLRRVKTDPKTSSIPVVILTASTNDRDLQASKELGADDYIIKPVDLKNLTAVTPKLDLQWALIKRIEQELPGKETRARA